MYNNVYSALKRIIYLTLETRYKKHEKDRAIQEY